jgi:hypothetical protein
MNRSTANARPTRILLQTTIPYSADDWHVGRFGLLADEMRRMRADDGSPLVELTTRNREPSADGNDPVLAGIAESDFDQVWLIAVDTGGDTGVTEAECRALAAFRAGGGALFSTRDHQDLGASICSLGGIGAAHFFHSTQHDPDASRNTRDDPYTTAIDFPNYHSGANGDVQHVTAPAPEHPVTRGVATLPAHPHEGGVGAPSDDPHARVVLQGISQATQRPFNIAVAFESDGTSGRGWAESTFHHFCDYNWDTSRGCPSFVEEAPSDALARNPSLLDDTRTYVHQLVRWLGVRAN